MKGTSQDDAGTSEHKANAWPGCLCNLRFLFIPHRNPHSEFEVLS